MKTRWGEMDVLITLIVVMVSQLHTCVKTHQIVCRILYVNFISIKQQENKKRGKDMPIKFKSLLTYVVTKSVGKQIRVQPAGENGNDPTSIERDLIISSQITNVCVQLYKLSCGPAIPLLRICTKHTLAKTQNDVCSKLFVEALFVTAKDWNQSEYPAAEY